MNSPLGKMIFTVMSGFAELETDLNRERTLEGLNEAKLEVEKAGVQVLRKMLRTMLCIYTIIQSYQVMRSQEKRV
ncbi:putative resolvase [Staphylococcus aureus]|nr:putative resolvase [Staphylococcus aureus]